MEKGNIHDIFFKDALAQKGATEDFLRYYLPAQISALIKPETAQKVDDSFVDDDLREHLSDLLYRVELKEEGEAFIYILLEHKSSPSKYVALQLLRYLVRIWEKAQRENAKTLPFVIPIVFYHGKTAWKISDEFSGLFEWRENIESTREFVPNFRYHLCDLAQFADENLQGSVNLQAAMHLLKYIFRPEILEHAKEAFRLIFSEPSKADTMERLRTFVAYLTKSERIKKEEIKQVFKQIKTHIEGENMYTVVDEIMDEGVQIGLQKGLQQGLQQGEAKVVLRQLGRRFGVLSPQTESQIRHLKSDQLEELSEVLLDFRTAQDLQLWLDENAVEGQIN